MLQGERRRRKRYAKEATNQIIIGSGGFHHSNQSVTPPGLAARFARVAMRMVILDSAPDSPANTGVFRHSQSGLNA